jgi:hypothetical protein
VDGNGRVCAAAQAVSLKIKDPGKRGLGGWDHRPLSFFFSSKLLYYCCFVSLASSFHTGKLQLCGTFHVVKLNVKRQDLCMPGALPNCT